MGSRVYSIVSQGSIIAELSITPMTQWIVKVTITQPYGYPLAFYILGGVTAIGLGNVLFLNTKHDWSENSLLEKGGKERIGNG